MGLHIEYSPLLRASGRRFEEAQMASKVLSDVLGPSAGLVTASWDLAQDANGRELVHLRLAVFAGSVSADFEPAELNDPAGLYRRLCRLWGDLLQERSHVQLQNLAHAEEAGA